MLKMEEDMQHFWCIMLYYFKKDKNTTETKKDLRNICREGAVTDEHFKSGLRSSLVLLAFWPHNSLPCGCLVH